jgi:D-beta-D-heptose 7-phosphate kinase/D-beta-D-heptose 1-phosphate adenosyltransferase
MTEKSDLAALVERLGAGRVLCVGDVMLDRYVYGDIERISPEAPIPVLRVQREVPVLGGAGNVARNVAALGGFVRLVAVVGDDAAGAEIRTLLEKEERVAPALLVDDSRRTTIKTRYVAARQQVLRADQESNGVVSDAIRAALLALAQKEAPECGVVVLSDYGKGVLSAETVRGLMAAARSAGRAVIVDPKGRDFTRYRGANLVTPNRRELAEAAGMPVDGEDAIVAAARRIIDTCGIEAVLVTRSEEGMTLVPARGSAMHVPAQAREVFDVSGAGDTAVAAVGVALASGIALADAVRLANAAAGIVVGKVGTAVVHADELVAALHTQDLLAGEDKVVTPAAARDRVEGWRRKALKIGFTNGCFDLLHPGHVSLLSQAKAACDRLVVGLNSDASVRRLKGDGRPVQSEAARAQVLASLASVDLVVVFGEDTPIALIEAVRPDVLVKGADYRPDQVVGADLVRGYGGRVLLADLVEGHSTTAMIARMSG